MSLRRALPRRQLVVKHQGCNHPCSWALLRLSFVRRHRRVPYERALAARGATVGWMSASGNLGFGTGRPFLRRITMMEDKLEAGRHPFDVAAFRGGLDVELRTMVTFFVGENGTGKSTLLEAVAACCGFNPEDGGPDHQFQTRPEPPTWRVPCALRGRAR